MKETPMNDAMGESLSALMDGEADDLSLRRILKDESEETKAMWARYHVARAAMQGQLNEFAPVDISTAVSAAIADEPAHSRTAPVATAMPQWLKPIAGFAVAASVAAVVVVAGNNMSGFESANTQIAQVANSVAPASSGRVFPVVPSGSSASGAQTVGLTARAGGQAQYVLTTDDPTLQSEFEHYVKAHAERAALNSGPGSWSYARWSEAQAPTSVVSGKASR